ncbi:MAG: hypothetical protein V1874_08920 [Spirochaetota bacterium]
MPLKFTSHASNNIFLGQHAIIVDEIKLVKWVASTLISKHNHILRIISSDKKDKKLKIKDTVVRSVIKKVLHAIDTDHRDGLLFQHISWICAAINKNKYDLLKAPHCRIADKGQDNLIIHLNKNNKITSISICEDKATSNVRDTIRDKVFPEFAVYESGEKDSELESEVLSMLEKHTDTNRAESLIKSIFWDQARNYKINVTITNEDPFRIFKDYENCIKGNVDRRTGNTIQIHDLRNWFTQFAKKIEDYLNSL